MKFLKVLIPLFCLLTYESAAQAYRWAAGVKLSKDMGLSVVYSPETPYSIEGIISKNFWTGESGISVAGRMHRRVISRGLNFYGGGGLHFGMYDDTERPGYGGLLLNGGAEISLGKTNVAFNISPVVGVGKETVKLKVGSDITVRHIIEKQPKRPQGILAKLGLVKSDKNKKKKSKKKEDKKILDFEWLKKK